MPLKQNLVAGNEVRTCKTQTHREIYKKTGILVIFLHSLTPLVLHCGNRTGQITITYINNTIQ